LWDLYPLSATERVEVVDEEDRDEAILFETAFNE
jgi:hypothetical protein